VTTLAPRPMIISRRLDFFTAPSVAGGSGGVAAGLAQVDGSKDVEIIA